MDYTIISLGCLGGALPDIIRLIKGRYGEEFPAYFRTPSFWVGFVLLVLLGGFTAWIGGASSAKEALAFGFGAPEAISRLLSSSDPVTKARGGALEKTRRFWSF